MSDFNDEYKKYDFSGQEEEILILPELKELDVPTVFPENKFNFVRGTAEKRNWKKVEDIDFNVLKRIHGIGITKYESVIKRVTDREELSKIQVKEDINPIPELMDYDIEKIFSERKFLILREIAQEKGWRKVKDIKLDILQNVSGFGKKKYDDIVYRITSKEVAEKYLLQTEEKNIKKVQNAIEQNTIPIHMNQNKYILLSDLEEILNMKSLEKYLETLQSRNKIEWTQQGVRYKFPKVKDIVNNLTDEKRKYIIQNRLEGKTYQEIGEALTPQLTRERIRQIIEKIIAQKEFKYTEECKYKDYFQKYAFEEKSFCSIFNEDKTTYYFLLDKYKKGNMPIEELLKDERIKENEVEEIDKVLKQVRIFGQVIPIDRAAIANVLIKEFAIQRIGIKEFVDKFNNFITTTLKEYNLKPYDVRTMEGLIVRSRKTIMGMHNMMRYYDYEQLTEQDINLLKNMVEVEDGCYSTRKFFDDNNQLMQEIDIRDEYELHNLLKNLKINNQNIKYLRMPNILIGYKDKKQFFEEKINELCPLKMEEFTKIMEEEYGHRTDSMYSYICLEFRNHVLNDMLYSQYEEMSKSDLQKLKSCMEDRLYNLAEFKKILKQLSISENCINNVNLAKINYRVRDSYILPEKYDSVDQYLKERILSQKFIKYDNILNKTTYDFALNSLLKEHLIIKIADKEYANIKCLENSGITIKDIEILIEEINNCFDENEFFSIYNVKQKINIEKFENIGLEDCFYEGVLFSMEEIQKIRIANQQIFCKNSQKKNISRISFIEEIVYNYEEIYIEDLQQIIEEKYDVKISYDELRNYVYMSNLYYNSILDKVFKNKEIYYNKIYQYDN